MLEIDALASERVNTSVQLKAVLREHALPNPGVGFTGTVMKHVAVQSAIRADKPVISTKGWLVVALFVVVNIVVAYTLDENGHSATGLVNLIRVGSFISGWLQRFQEPLKYLVIIMLASGMVLALEHWITKPRLAR
jgi:hypothetical protein